MSSVNAYFEYLCTSRGETTTHPTTHSSMTTGTYCIEETYCTTGTYSTTGTDSTTGTYSTMVIYPTMGTLTIPHTHRHDFTTYYVVKSCEWPGW